MTHVTSHTHTTTTEYRGILQLGGGKLDGDNNGSRHSVELSDYYLFTYSQRRPLFINKLYRVSNQTRIMYFFTSKELQKNNNRVSIVIFFFLFKKNLFVIEKNRTRELII